MRATGSSRQDRRASVITTQAGKAALTIEGLRIGIVVIGRNEGARLTACVVSLPDGLPVVYVDSGSTDGSVDAARDAGAEVVALDMSIPFSAARARNEGFFRLLEIEPTLDAVQFLDGDTALREGWLEAAARFLAQNPEAVAVAGRRRERFPERSLYNAFCDDEWAQPTGPCEGIGGDSLMRADAFRAVGGFRPDVIAGEEPELCFRLREAGGTIHRLPDEMTWHDAAITTFSANWRRAQRSGYAYALGLLLHGRNGFKLRETARIIVWGAALPILAAILVFTTAWPGALVIVTLYLAKFIRLRREFAPRTVMPGRFAALTMVGNVAEVFGVVRCLAETITGRRQILEYK